MGRTLAEQLTATYILNNPAAVQVATRKATLALIADTEQTEPVRSDTRSALAVRMDDSQILAFQAEHPADSWNPADDLFGADDELDEAAIEADLCGDADDEPEGEHEHPAHGLVVSFVRLDKSGWLTPLSDPVAWRTVYEAAWAEMARCWETNAGDLDLNGQPIKNMQICEAMRVGVSELMTSGVANQLAGVVGKSVAPWALGVRGGVEMQWIKVVPGTPDPTTNGFKAGMGECRLRHMKDINGNMVVEPECTVEEAMAYQARKDARRFECTKRKLTVPARDALQAKRDQAHAMANVSKAHAAPGQEERDYMWTYAAAFRVLGEIHTVFEARLAELGIDNDDIMRAVAQLRGK